MEFRTKGNEMYNAGYSCDSTVCDSTFAILPFDVSVTFKYPFFCGEMHLRTHELTSYGAVVVCGCPFPTYPQKLLVPGINPRQTLFRAPCFIVSCFIDLDLEHHPNIILQMFKLFSISSSPSILPFLSWYCIPYKSGDFTLYFSTLSPLFYRLFDGSNLS